MKEFVALRIGVTGSDSTSEQVRQWQDEGHLHEPDVIARLRGRYGLEVVAPTGDESQIEVEVDFPEIGVMLRGHIDGAAVGAQPYPWDGGGMLPAPDADAIRSLSWPRVIEVKARSKLETKKWIDHRFDAFDHMAAQVSAYMHGLPRIWVTEDGEVPEFYPALICTKNRDSGALDLYPVEVPPWSYAKLQSYLAEIEEAAQVARPDGRRMPACGNSARFGCSVHWLCDRQLLATADPGTSDESSGDPARDDLIASLADELDRAREAETAAKERTEEARQRLLDVLGEEAKWSRAGVTVDINTTIRQIPDTKALKEEMGDRWESFLKPSRSTTVRITRKEV